MTTARTSEDVSVNVTPSVARALLSLAGFEHDERGRWAHDDGRWTWATDEALRWALVSLAEDDDEQYAAPARSQAQVRCLTALSKDRGSLTAWNMIASGDVVCRFEDGSIVRMGKVINPDMGEIVYPAPRGGYLLRSSWHTHWQAIRASAGMPGQDFYELKHRAIQWMVDPVEDGGLGLDPATAAAMVGHDDGGYLIATVYTKLAQRRALARAQRAMDAYQQRQTAATAEAPRLQVVA